MVSATETPFWQVLADKGHDANIFRQLDLWGEEEVRRKQPTFGENYGIASQLWLKALNEVRETERREEQAAELAARNRSAQTNERAADAAVKSAEAAVRSATAAESSATEAKRYRRVAFSALVVSILALLVAIAAIFAHKT